MSFWKKWNNVPTEYREDPNGNSSTYKELVHKHFSTIINGMEQRSKEIFLKKSVSRKKRLNGMGHQWNKKNRVIFLKKLQIVKIQI